MTTAYDLHTAATRVRATAGVLVLLALLAFWVVT